MLFLQNQHYDAISGVLALCVCGIELVLNIVNPARFDTGLKSGRKKALRQRNLEPNGLKQSNKQRL